MRHANKVLLAIAGSILLVVAYVALSGPVVWLYATERLPGWAYDAYTAPLRFAADHNPQFRRAWLGYAIRWAVYPER